MFGKILVLLHLGLSLLFATWALVLYTSRVDWSATKGKDGRPDGELVARMADYDKLARGAVRPADARFRESRDKLLKEEKARPEERAWYAKQLDFLTSNASENNPATQVLREKKGNPNEGDIIIIADPKPGGDLLKMGVPQDKDGNPLVNRDNQPIVLKSLDYYTKEYNTLVAQETAAMKRRHEAAERDTTATNLLKGHMEKKGLHAKLRDEAVKQERIGNELDEVRPLWLNTMVEYQNLGALGKRLEQRLKELDTLKSRGNKLGE